MILSLSGRRLLAEGFLADGVMAETEGWPASGSRRVTDDEARA
jgi:hypothetical protein